MYRVPSHRGAGTGNAIDVASAIDHRWLIAARGFSVLALTAHVRALPVFFRQPPEPLRQETWRELHKGLTGDDHETRILVLGSTWMAEHLHSPLPQLRKVCSRTHSLVWQAWPGHSLYGWLDRDPSRPDDGSLVQSVNEAAAGAPICSAETLLLRTRKVLADELAQSGIAQAELEPDEGNGAIWCDAVADLLAAEWALLDAGHDRAAGRVALARTVLGTALAGPWLPEMRERAGRAAAGVIAMLQRGWS